MNCAPEIWRDVVGFEGLYEVSTLGRVYSHRSRRCLRPGPMKSGHLTVVLGRGNTRQVHALVLEAFDGPRPSPKHDGRHLNGVESDNDLWNLAWSTRSRNSQDKKWHKGTKTYRLSGKQAAEVKRRLAAGDRGVDLSREFGIAQSTVSAIRKGKFHRDA